MFILTTQTPLIALINLEATTQDFILETKKIEIPGYPHAFNASVIRWQDSLLLGFRVIPDPKSSFTSYLGIAHLDEDFQVIGDPQILVNRDQYSLAPSRAEDPRLLTVGNRLYMVYSDNEEPKISKGGFRVYIAELRQDQGYFSMQNIECLSRYEGESRAIREKNWVPFDCQGSLLLAYSLLPHLIFHPIHGTGSCETVASTTGSIQWDWGILRGGTAALLERDEYLAFFHSSKEMETAHSEGKRVLHYFMGAYTFSRHPPFEITQMSPEPIIGKKFYKGPIYKPYWHPVRVVFPGGFVMDDTHIWVTYGRQDHEIWVTKLDKKGLLDSLRPVSTTQ